MHILLITTSYPDSGSGSEAAGGFVADFAQQLAKHARVSVAAPTSAASSVREEGAVCAHRFKVRRWPLSLLRPHFPVDWWAIYSTLRDGRATVRDLVANDRPDYIFALWALPSGYWARDILKDYDIPYSTWALGSDIWSLGRIPILRGYLRNILRAADRCFADGLELADSVALLSGKSCSFLPSSRLLTQEPQRDVAARPPYRLAFLGRWHPNKGIDILMDALVLLSNDDWSKIDEIRIYGGGPLSDYVHRIANALRRAGRPVQVGGYLDKESAGKFIAWSDFMMLPSRIESIPVIFSDAAQMKRPIIAAPVGDLPRLFERNRFGILSSGATALDFANAIHEALGIGADKFAAELDAIADEFDVSAAARKVLQQARG